MIVKTGCGTDGALHSTRYYRYWTPRVVQVPALQLRPVHPRTTQVPAAGHTVQTAEAGRHVLHLCGGVTTFIVT